MLEARNILIARRNHGVVMTIKLMGLEGVLVMKYDWPTLVVAETLISLSFYATTGALVRVSKWMGHTA